MKLVYGIAVLLALAAFALADVPSRRFVVEVSSTGEAWRAEALAEILRHDLVDSSQILHDGTGTPDLVVRISIEKRALRYELRAQWPGAPAPVAGTAELGAANRVDLAGTLRDRMHRLGRSEEQPELATALELPNAGTVALVIAAVLALFALPFALGVALLGIARVVAMPAARRAIGSILAIGGSSLGLAAAASGDLPNATGIVAGAGGLAWGSWLVATFPIVFPPVTGLARVEHEVLPRVLRLWIVVALQRLVAVAILYGPLAALAWVACDAAGHWPVATAALAIPLVLLTARLWMRSAIAVVALWVDRALVDRTANADAWDAAVRGYLIGYHRRNGLPLDEHLLARVKILVGASDEVAVYGGGLTHSRIVIPRKMMELALAPAGRPHDYAAPRVSVLHWTHWNAGLVMATAPGAPAAETTRELRTASELAVEGEYERILIGAPPTLAGIIEPSTLDERKTYRPEEDPMWLDWDPGDEYDGTDAGDRDFLFGLLVHALGEIRRHRDRAATLRFAARRVVRRVRPLRAIATAKLGGPLRAIARLARRAPASLADEHAALGGARHHLVQYLGWRLWQREDLLTARAYAPELEAASRKVLSTMRANRQPDLELARRLERLGARVSGVAPVPMTNWGRLALTGAVLGVAAAAAFAIVDAVRYHPVYAQAQETPDGSKSK